MNKPCIFRRRAVRALANRAIAAGAVFCMLLWSCASSAPQTQNALSAGGVTPARHVIFIGLDGWGGAYVKKADMPTVKRMISGGASSLDMRCIMPSVSWPNWSTLFCGAAPEERTTGNQQNQPENGIGDFPSIFSIVKDVHRPGESLPALFYEWSEIGKICSVETADHIRITTDRASAEKAASYIKEKKPAFTAIVFDQPDAAGHSRGWGRTAYYDKLAELDRYIALVEQAVKDSGMYEDTVFVLSGDHGGSSRGHGLTFPSHRRIPFIVYGREIKQAYSIPSPLSIRDIAPTLAAILGLEVPPKWTGRPLREIFR